MIDFVWLTKELVLSRFGENPLEALNRFVEFIQNHSEVKIDAKEIFESINLGIYGSNNFIKATTSVLPIPHQLVAGILSLESAVNHICAKFQVNMQDLSSSSKLKHIVNARSVLALLGRVGQQNWNLQDVARLLNKNPGSISRLASRAESEPNFITYIKELLSD
jgi:chromosomal replication initiation ATPase DnaA